MRRPDVGIVASVVEEGRLQLKSELLAHCRKATAALVAPAELNDGIVEHLRVDEVNITCLGKVTQDWEVVTDGKVGHADPRERLKVASRVVEDLTRIVPRRVSLAFGRSLAA